jgi:hypothetical protein
MAESKSAGLFNDFKARLEKMVETRSSNSNNLAVAPNKRCGPGREDQPRKTAHVDSSAHSILITECENGEACEPMLAHVVAGNMGKACGQMIFGGL